MADLSRHRSLDPIAILRASSKVSGANLVGLIAMFVANLEVARVVGPATYGVIGYLQLWLFYAKTLRPGSFNASMREVKAPLCWSKGATIQCAPRAKMLGSTTELLSPPPQAPLSSSRLRSVRTLCCDTDFCSPLLRTRLAPTSYSWLDMHWA